MLRPKIFSEATRGWKVTWWTTDLMDAAGTSLVLPNWALITPLQKESFYGAQLKVTRKVHRTCLRSMFRTALWKRLWIVKDKEW